MQETAAASGPRDRGDACAIDDEAKTEEANLHRNVPWQMEWKHPQWITSGESLEETSEDDNIRVVGITSAVLSASEISQFGKTADADDNHYLLTVTLLGNPSIENKPNDESTGDRAQSQSLASEVLLEVVDVPGSNPAGTEVIRSKRLRWPESIFDPNTTAKTKPRVSSKAKKRKNLLEKVFLPLMGIDENDEYGNERAERPTKKQQQLSSSIGIVSATLCRRPQEDTKNISATRDIVELMSFGDIGVADAASDDGSRSESKKDLSTPNAENKQNKQNNNNNNNTGELSFCCVSQAGEVFVYDPISLLLGIQQHNTSNKNLEDMSNFFFGQELFQNLEQNWKPLAEPTTRIHLSIFEHDHAKKQKKNSKKMVQSNQEVSDQSMQSANDNQSVTSSQKHNLNASIDDASTIATSATDALTVVQHMAVELQSNVDEALSMLPYLLNPLLEPSTLKDRTIKNQPHTISVSGSAYIVVTGSGVKQKTRKQNSWEDNASHEPATSKSLSKNGEQDADSKNKDAWWEDEAVDPEEKADNSVQASSKIDEGGDTAENDKPFEEKNCADDNADESSEGRVDVDEAKLEGASESAEKAVIDSDAGRDDSTCDDKASEKSPVKSLMKDDEEDSQRHYFDGYENTRQEDDSQDRGGFVTFLSTARWSETRTLFLPFVPVRTSHISEWNGMELLWVIGEFETLLIRMDSTGPVPVRIRDILPLESFQTITASNRTTSSTVGGLEISPLSVKRFEILPIDLGTSMSPRLLCASNTGIDPPSILELHVDPDTASIPEEEISKEHQRYQQALVLQKTLGYCTPQGTVVLRHAPSHVAKIMVDRDDSSAIADGSIFAEHGQGWSLVGSKARIHFICWEGSTLLQGAYVEELHRSPESMPLELKMTPILPLSMTRDASLETTEKSSAKDTDFESSQRYLSSAIANLPFIDEFQPPASPIPNTDRTLGSAIFSPTSGSKGFSRRENYEHLLRRCSSWAQLEDTLSNRIAIERTEPVLCLRGGTSGLPHRMLSLRQLVVENGRSSPFQQVLAWLAKRKNFFVAAGIALDLLKDGDTLYHLWKHAERIDEDDEETKLFGLLDGISPVRLLDENQTVNEHKHSVTATHLSDMTVGCFIKGGASMAKTLERFLEYNESYDPQRVSLMLSLTTIDLFSKNPMELRNFDNSSQEEILDELLWPIKCLLSVGTEREYLHEVLTILNNTIPDELRHRHPEDEEKEEEKTVAPSLTLTKNLIQLILESDALALEMLMGFVDDRSATTFWQSLDHPTRLALSLMETNSFFPFLRHPDVRAWAREQLDLCFQGKSDLPTSWLQEVSVACLQNASCDVDDLRVIDDISDPPLETSEPDAIDTTSDTGVGKLDTGCRDNPVESMKLETEKTRNALLPSSKIYGIDYDLLIPTLLLLEIRNSHWLSPLQLSTFTETDSPTTEKMYVSTQFLLNAACHLAGRAPGSTSSSFEEPFLFAGFDGKSAMKQCYQAKNVVAGAYLIGGKNGFLLHVSEVLHRGIGMPIPDAESFLLKDSLDLTVIVAESKTFELTDGHQKLLLLLEEHVLGIKTFGDFDFAHNRGTVDPVFCARSILRAWLCLGLGDRAASSSWLGNWLEVRLGIKSSAESSGDTPRSKNKNDTSIPNKHRLACASLVRSLLWPNNAATPTKQETNAAFEEPSVVDVVPLASTMEFEKKLLIELCQSCLGLVESVPPPVVREIQI